MPVKKERYLAALSAVELSLEGGVPPKPATARRWAAEAPEGFVHALVAPPALAKAPDRLPPGLEGEVGDYGGLRTTPQVLGLFERTAEAARALAARALVVVTPASLAPGPAGKERVRSFFEAVRRAREGLVVAWEPHGPWGDAEVAGLCGELDLVRAVDPLRDPVPEGRVAYARLGPFAAMGRSMADDELEAIVEALEPFEEAFCFFATDRAFSDARRLRAILADG